VKFRLILLAVALAIGGATLDGRPAGGAGIGDVISDFLYYQEELRVKAPARPAAETITGSGERYLGVIDTDGAVRLWDFETGGQVTVEGRKPADARAVFPNQRGADLIVADGSGRVLETNGMTFTSKTRLLAPGSASEAIAISSRAPVVAAAGGGKLQIHNFVTKQTVLVPVSARVTGLWVSDDGRFAAYEGGVAAVIDADRQVSLPLEPAGPAGQVRFYYDAAGAVSLARLAAPTRLTLYKFDGQGFARTGEHSLGSAPDAFWIGTGGQLYWTAKNVLYGGPLGGREKTVFTAKEPIAHVRNVKDDLLIAHQSGLLAVLSGKTGKVVATAISTANGWAVIDASKRYDGSTSGGREIAWVIQKIDLDLEKFARHFYEPGLLLHYVGQQPLAFASAGLNGPVPAPPTIADAKVLQNVEGSSTTVVLATARNIKDDVDGIEIYLNGKRVADAAKIAEETKKKDDLRFRSVGFQIFPVAGPNTVAVVGVGRLGIEGPTRDLTFTRPGAPSGALRALTVGIDRYGVAALKLGYARRDAEAIAGLLRASQGFDRVDVAELYDASATREAVLNALRATARSAAPGDAIIVYLAGHGITIGGNWYFLSPAVQDVDEAEITKLSLSAEQISTTLRESKASRVVLMIDACYSGAVVKDVKGLLQNRVYTQLGRATGFAVLAAARQDQSALERNTLGHGVFTAAIIAALTGAADRNGDGKITARELAAYLARQIPTLATEHLNEVQIPVAYAPSEDFVVRALR
jgi:caspase domain-containing protein